MAKYERPTTLENALRLISDGQWRVLAGGTDFYPAQGARPIHDDVLDVSALDELRGISATQDGIRVGARTTWTDVLRADLPPAFDALKQAAREVGSVQIQNVGTVAGNLCNASPAADGVPPLLALDAKVELCSAAGVRLLPLSEFILGNRKTARRSDELLTAIDIPASAIAGVSAFKKLGARKYLVISIAMAAARLVIEDGRVVSAALAIGSCSEVAQRLTSLEQALVDAPADAGIVDRLRPGHFAGLAPINDVRGTAEYRHVAAREIVSAALLAALDGEGSGRAAA